MPNNNSSRSFWDVVKALFGGRASEHRPESERTLYPDLPPVGSPEHTKLLLHAIQIGKQLRTPPPPPRIPTKEEVLATRQPAIILQRAVLPIPLDAPGCSYLGGLPRLPPELPWPEKAAYGEVFALTFLAQIDLSELPALESSPLPRSGTLFFFADTRNDPDPGDWSVLYHPGAVTNVPFRELPANSRIYDDGGAPWPWFGAAEIWAHTTFRFPLQFIAFDSYRDFLPDERTRSRAGLERPPARNEEALAELMRPQFEPLLGAPAQSTENPWLRFSADDHWPFAWAAIDYAARSMVNCATEMQRRTRAKTPEAAAEFERIGSRALQWIERARSHEPHTQCDQHTRAVFLNDWHELELSFKSTCALHGTYGPQPVLVYVGLAACYVCASNGAAEVIPPMLRDALETATRWTLGDHQMLGYGNPVQWAAIHHAHDRMLLQLTGDFALGWNTNSGCVIQFWINPEALRRRAFGEVEMTLECD